MRIVFMGTPEFAAASLSRLTEAGYAPVLVYAQPDRPAGRGRTPSAPPVKVRAAELQLPVEQPLDANSRESLRRLQGAEPDLFVVVAYGCILSPELLAVPKLGAVNLHASLLPDYRGASPIAQAILDGRTETGVSTLWMDDGIDTGDVIAQRPVRIEEDETAGELSQRLSHAGADLLAETVAAIDAKTASRTPQDRNAGTYCRKLKKKDGVVTWAQSATQVARHVRAMTPWPGAFTDLVAEGRAPLRVLLERVRAVADVPSGEPGSLQLDGKRLLAAAAEGSVELLAVRPAGKRPLAAADWWRGLRLEEARFVPPADDV